MTDWLLPIWHIIEKVTIQHDGGYSPLVKAPLVYGGIFGFTYLGLTLWNNFYRESIEIKRDQMLAELQEAYKHHQGLENTSAFQEKIKKIEKESETMISQMTFRRHTRLNLASHLTSMAHAVSVIGLTAYGLWHGPHWNDVNTLYQNQVAMWSLGYFLFDTFYLFMHEFTREFFCHHAIIGGFLASCYHLNQGAYYALLGLLVGEITNPVQLIWSFARKNKLTKLYNALSPIFTIYFVSVRCVVIPIVTAAMNYHLFYNSSVELQWKLVWMALGWGMNLVSWWWCYMLWLGYKKYFLKKSIAKT